MHHFLKILPLFFNLCLFAQQKQDSIVPLQQLDEVVLKVTKIPTKNLRAPLAASLVFSSKNALLEPQLSINESLISVPGLFAQNAFNYNQDLRVSIRGFGARSAFGIRGVKLIVDGIPETTPDGQGQIDNILVGLIDRIEVLRGPSASLYGNASGGVIHINTLDEIAEKVRINFTSGSYGLTLSQALVNLSKNNSKSILAINHSQSNGYRVHSSFNQFQTNYKSIKTISDSHKLLWQINYTHSPNADDSGGLTLDQVIENPMAAREANINYDSREAIDHIKTGLQLSSKLKSAIMSNHFYAAHRNFIGYLPFKSGGVSAFKRFYWGLGSSINRSTKKGAYQMGWSHDRQVDHRKRYDNLNGSKGDLQEQQDEHYSNTALYMSSQTNRGNWSIQSGIRADHIALSFTKKEKQSYSALSPSLGLHFKLDSESGLYTRYSESFQTPTLSELSNDPNGSLGFNTELEPTKAKNIELGFKHKSQNSQFEIALFSIRSKGDLVAYSIENYPGRTFYNNAGNTKRTGIEFSYLKSWKNFRLQQSYSYSDFRFDTTDNHQYLPGIPRHNFYNRITQDFSNGIQLALSSVFWGTLYATSSNSVEIKSQFYSHLSMSKSFDRIDIKMGVNNVLNNDYYDNIRVNAFGGRYYEPAPKRNLYIGLSWKLY